MEICIVNGAKIKTKTHLSGDDNSILSYSKYIIAHMQT